MDILEFLVSTALFDPLSPTVTMGYGDTFYNDFPAVLDHSLDVLTGLPPMTFMMRNMRLKDALDLVTCNYHLTYQVTETNILLFNVDGILLNKQMVHKNSNLPSGSIRTSVWRARLFAESWYCDPRLRPSSICASHGDGPSVC